MVQSRLARYPVEYHQIILALPADGSPLIVPFASPDAAARERLQIYNFLKFLQRNPVEASKFNGRHHLMVMSLKGNEIHFSLRQKSGSSALAQALANLQAETGQALPPVDLGNTLPFTMDIQAADNMREWTGPAPAVEAPNPYARYFPTEPAPVPASAPASAPQELPIYMRGDPVKLPDNPDQAEFFRRIAAEREADAAIGAAEPKAHDLSDEMKAWNVKHYGTPYKP